MSSVLKRGGPQGQLYWLWVSQQSTQGGRGHPRPKVRVASGTGLPGRWAPACHIPGVSWERSCYLGPSHPARALVSAHPKGLLNQTTPRDSKPDTEPRSELYLHPSGPKWPPSGQTLSRAPDAVDLMHVPRVSDREPASQSSGLHAQAALQARQPRLCPPAHVGSPGGSSPSAGISPSETSLVLHSAAEVPSPPRRALWSLPCPTPCVELHAAPRG